MVVPLAQGPASRSLFRAPSGLEAPLANPRQTCTGFGHHALESRILQIRADKELTFYDGPRPADLRQAPYTVCAIELTPL